MTHKVREQIMSIRNSGKTNMFDTSTVQRLASDDGYYELVVFIEENLDEYLNFILRGGRSK